MKLSTLIAIGINDSDEKLVNLGLLKEQSSSGDGTKLVTSDTAPTWLQDGDKWYDTVSKKQYTMIDGSFIE